MSESNVIGKFGLGVRNKAEKQLMKFCETNQFFYYKHVLHTTKKTSVFQGHQQMANIEENGLCDWKKMYIL